MKQSGIKIEVKVDESLYLNCRGSQISQVLINLLNNAYDAIRDLEAKDRWIQISSEVKNDRIRIRVIDGGGGISSELAEKIFLPFHTTKEPGKGTGLGLSISSKIMKDHGGFIRVNQAFRNTCFELDLPMMGN